MFKTIVRLITVVVVLGMLTTVSYGQLAGLYEFDAGGDGTSWDDANNWEQVTDPDGNPISGDPATPPDPMTSADLPLPGVVIDSTMPGQTALDVNIGTASGAGSLSISGGDLTARDVNVGGAIPDPGRGNSGDLNVSGGQLVAGDDITVGRDFAGTMTQSNGMTSTGDDFFVNADSSFTMTGGSLFVGDRLVTEANGTVHVDGGDIVADDDFFFFGASQITVDSGSMTVFDKMRMDDPGAKVTVNGGLVRSQEFGFVDGDGNYIMEGILEINGDGLYQSEAPGVDSPASQLSVAMALALIADGTIITSELSPLALGVSTVIVPEFDGRTDVTFTQISIVPEPAGALLLLFGSLGMMLRRKLN